MDGRVKKRKAETLDFNNDRLSKKLSTLNLGSYLLLILSLGTWADFS